MALLPSSSILITIFSFSSSFASSMSISSQQCWYQHPLSTVILQTSLNGHNQLVKSSAPHILPSSTDHFRRESLYAPWSYPPVCTEHLESINSKLCVYTNASFSHGRGISIFTTPSIASHFATLPPFQNPNILHKDNINTNSGSWYTASLAGRGIGMLAARPLSFKDRVTAYTPAFLAYLESELGTMEREKFFRIAVDQLPEKTRSMYLDLATVYGIEQVKYQDVVKANTFQVGVDGVNHLAIFPETARLNHACAPNAQYYIDPDLLTHFVHITRPVAKDEEITISYTSPLFQTDLRQQHLAEGFHFKCTCQRCSNKEATDTTLQTIDSLQASLNDWSSTTTGSPSVAEELLQMYRDEGLEGFMDIPYGFAALAYNAVGDTKKATIYAEKAQELILMKDGPWTPNLQIWRELLKDPRSHWSYKRRLS